MRKLIKGQYSLFDETIYEYFILLSPDDAIKEKVDHFKQVLHGMIGLDDANMKSVAHISLFKHEGIEEAAVINRIKKAVAGHRQFTIKIAGCQIYKNGAGRTLSLKIINPEPVIELYQLLAPRKNTPTKTNRQVSILDKPVRTRKPINPHITIARNVPGEKLDTLTDLSAFDYSAEWICRGITILKRPLGTERYYSPVAVVMLAE